MPNSAMPEGRALLRIKPGRTSSSAIPRVLAALSRLKATDGWLGLVGCSPATTGFMPHWYLLKS